MGFHKLGNMKVVGPLGDAWCGGTPPEFYSISGVIGTQHLFKFHLVLITFLKNIYFQSCCMYLRRIETIKAIAFSKIWHEYDYHYELRNIWLV